MGDEPGEVVLIWDGAPWHKAKRVQAAASELGFTVVALPSYSPDLNPIEGLWKWMREEVTRNFCHASMAISLMPVKPSSIVSMPIRNGWSRGCGQDSNSTWSSRNSWYQSERTLDSPRRHSGESRSPGVFRGRHFCPGCSSGGSGFRIRPGMTLWEYDAEATTVDYNCSTN